MSHQIRAEFAGIEQLGADQNAHAGSVEGYRESLRQQAMVALGNLDGGMGTEQHQACMSKVDQLIDAHIAATQGFRRGTGSAGDALMAGGLTAQTRLASG